MFDKNDMLQKAIGNLYSALKDEEYGKKYSWDELREKTGYEDLPQDTLYYVANRVCLILMQEDAKYLSTVHGFGKRIIQPSEHTVVAKQTVKKSVKVYRKAGAILASTNIEELSDEQAKEVVFAADKYRTLEMFASEMLKKKQIGRSTPSDQMNASLFLDAIKFFTDKG